MVIYNYHWTPEVIDGLYLDEIDHLGLKYHFETIDGVNKRLTKNGTKTDDT